MYLRDHRNKTQADGVLNNSFNYGELVVGRGLGTEEGACVGAFGAITRYRWFGTTLFV